MGALKTAAMVLAAIVGGVLFFYWISDWSPIERACFGVIVVVGLAAYNLHEQIKRVQQSVDHLHARMDRQELN